MHDFRGGGEPRNRQSHGPHATQQGAATPGQGATEQGAVPGRPATSQSRTSDPTAHRIGRPPPRSIRFLAATDLTPTGTLALEYLKAFLRLGLQVKLGSISGGLSGKWTAYSALLATPMPITLFVNVVCCDPCRWAWEQRVPMPRRLATGELELPGEVAVGLQELYTTGVWNVLITDEYDGARIQPHQLESALKYETVVVPNELSRIFWTARRSANPRLIPVPVAGDSLRVLESILI